MSSSPLPLSRPILVSTLPPGGKDVVVEATAEERAALATAFNLVAVGRLSGHFVLHPAGTSVNAKGRVDGVVTQTCTVSLEPFDAIVSEEVDLQFMPESGVEAWMTRHRPDPSLDLAYEIDPPDTIVDNRIDLGAVTAEFLALGLDPYPRKPGIAFERGSDPADKDPSPFAALADLKKGLES